MVIMYSVLHTQACIQGINAMQQWGFIFVSFVLFRFVLWFLYAFTTLVVRIFIFLFARLNLLISVFVGVSRRRSRAISICDGGKTSFIVFNFCILCYLFLPFPFSLSPVLSFHCNLLTWILSTHWPLPYLFFCHECVLCSAHKFNEHVRTAWMPLFVPFLFSPICLVLLCRCSSASH